jgi:cell division protease FtsH
VQKIRDIITSSRLGFSDISGSFPLSGVAQFEFNPDQPETIRIHVHGTDASNHDERHVYAVPAEMLRDGLERPTEWTDIKIWPAAQHPTTSHPYPMRAVRFGFGQSQQGLEKVYQISHRLISAWVQANLGDHVKASPKTIEPGRLAPGSGPAASGRGEEVTTDDKDPNEEYAEKSGARLYLPGELHVSADDIIGQGAAKKKLRQTIEYMKDPERFLVMEARARRALLFVGGPGLGKTLMARHVASEAGVPMLVTNGSSFMEQFVGVGAARMRALFEWAKHLAEEHGGCMVFCDEIDTIGRQRSGDSNGGEQQQTINALLAELDGFDQTQGVLFIAATNFEKILDEALLSRFDDSNIMFHSPTAEEREQMLELYLSERLRAADVDLTAIARMTRGASGRILEKVANEAKLAAVFAGATTVNQQMLDEAEAEVTIGARREGKVLTDEEFKFVAIHECGHALPAYLLGNDAGERIAPLRFTVVPRGNTGGHVMQDGGEGEFGYTKTQLLNRIAVSMGGVAAVKLFGDGREDTGPSGDFENATRTAKMLVMLGMSKLGFISQDAADPRLCSEWQRAAIDQEISRLMTEGFERVEQVLTENQSAFNRILDAIIEKETILGDEFAVICEAA